MKLIIITFILSSVLSSAFASNNLIEMISVNQIEKTNHYLEINKNSISKNSAKEALEYININSLSSNSFKNIEIIQRLREIAFN
jgi:hypothetical protein